MHHVLSIRELLDAIFGYLEPSENEVNALVCERWLAVALDLLWREVVDARRLFQLLAPLTVKRGKYEFKRPPDSAHWQRFEKYAVRVKSFKHARYNISPNLFDDVARTRTCLDILPNLHTLHWDRPPLRHIIMFMHNRIKHLSVKLEGEGRPILRSVFAEAISRMPNITSVELYFRLSHIDGTEDDSLYLLSNLLKLQAIHFFDFDVTPKLVETLSRFQHLRSIKGDGPTDILIATPLEGTFSALNDLSLEITFGGAENFFRLAYPCPNQLSKLVVDSPGVETHPEIKSFLTVISENCKSLKILTLLSDPGILEDDNYQGPWESITLDSLLPMLKLSNLRSLHFSHCSPFDLTQKDVEVMASSWPLLEHLWLNCQPVLFYERSPLLTLDALNPFARLSKSYISWTVHQCIREIATSPGFFIYSV